MNDRTLDCSDLDRYLGKPMQPGRLKEPLANNDIRQLGDDLEQRHHSAAVLSSLKEINLNGNELHSWQDIVSAMNVCHNLEKIYLVDNHLAAIEPSKAAHDFVRPRFGKLSHAVVSVVREPGSYQPCIKHLVCVLSHVRGNFC